MKLSKQEIIRMAEENLIKDEQQEILKGVFSGETSNGFYAMFWTEPLHPKIRFAKSGAMIRDRYPAPGTPGLFISKIGFIVLYWRIPSLMFDHYLNEGLISPEPVLDEQGQRIYYMGLPRYGVDVGFLIDEFNAVSAGGESCYQKYGNFPNPEKL